MMLSSPVFRVALAVAMAPLFLALPKLAAATPSGNFYEVAVYDLDSGELSSDQYGFDTEGDFTSNEVSGLWFDSSPDLWIAFYSKGGGTPETGILVGTVLGDGYLFGYGFSSTGERTIFYGPESVDIDGDRLPDSVETNTGVYVSPTDTGTDPNNPDTDSDSIGDGDEVLGTLAGLDLPGMGASPLRKTILIEYDWFDDGLECGSHTHRPNANVMNRVAASFAIAPVPNPDGSTGIDMIQDYGQGGIFSQGNLIPDGNGVLAGGVNSSEFKNHKSNHFDANREDYFHYTILPHRYNTNSGSSGQAELPGDDMIVSLYCARSDTNVSNTIVHELGHNLYLQHGGFEGCNYKPNYNSVMNYMYQFPGVDDNCTPPGDGPLDYSLGDRISLNENSLNEFNGTCGPGFPWDWNGNGVIQPNISYDINPSGNSTCGSNFSVLNDFDDWANLRYSGVDDSDLTVQEVIECTNEPPM